MKKLTVILLSVVLVFCALSMMASAAAIEKDENGIAMLNWLDFSPENTEKWAAIDPETGKWTCTIAYATFAQPVDEDWNPISTYMRTYTSYSGGEWSLVENGEVLHYEATTTSVYPGMAFVIDDSAAGCMPVGSETNATSPAAEFVKIRVRNYSTANRITFGFATKNTNGGKFMTLSISDMKEDANGKSYKSGSGEWETYVFSMNDIEVATNYGSQLVEDSEGNLISRWSTNLYEFLVFPFGYNVTDGTGSYAGAQMDIDYIVIGSRDYVTNYKSALEAKEESIAKLELVKEPTKKAYYVGESIDLEGLKLKATYKDGTTEEFDSASTTVNLASPAESTDVKLTFGSQSVSYKVKVTGIKSVEVLEEPESKVYERAAVASSFVYDGFKFKVTYVDGTVKEDIAPGSFVYSSDFTTAGTKTVTVNYFGIKTEIKDVEIIDVVDFEIEPKKPFKYGDTINADALNIYYVYTDGSKKLHGDKDTKTSLTLEVSGTVGAPGATPVAISGVNSTLGIDLQKELSVDVLAPVEMRIKQEPTTLKYNVGDSFDSLGMIVEFVYEDGTTATLKDADYKFRYDFSEPGSKKVRVLSNVEGIDLETSLNATVEGEIIGTKATEPTHTTKTAEPSDGAPIGLIVGIVAAVVVIVAVVVVILLKKKKSK